MEEENDIIVTWENLQARVTSGKNRKLLNDLTSYAQPGKLLAIIDSYEPTSGLNSATFYYVMTGITSLNLKDGNHRTIVASIHQPSSQALGEGEAGHVLFWRGDSLCVHSHDISLFSPLWRVTQSLTLQPNPGSWNRIFGLLFLDSPIGSGFSVASTPEEIPRDQNAVAKHLFAAITKFLQLDPLFKHRPVYITGESYAGKYVPAIGYYILKKNENLEASERVNLAGVAIGDGLTDPETQVVSHAVNAYYVGLINERQKNELEKGQLEAVGLIQKRNWSAATDARSKTSYSITFLKENVILLAFTEPFH
ncbi:Serine carboxypeptidase-like 50 [Vigna angularis]|uniref:Carboxypeptidase n=1 Tax=Phaseolus angularis TaxID=3914 RepID=A0A8T0LBM5_PHAAN|nr:Serine carboxypeptidase-like 50 [Vigna angularis]